MIKSPSPNRRGFIVGVSGLGAGLTLGFTIPFDPLHAVEASSVHETGAPEINAWVLIRPDDTVAIRIARPEMGQGTLTGLAQLVAEELECDWSKVTTEYPTPGQSSARNHVWGELKAYGSYGIRASQDYVRIGGAAAREMLVRAAANEWGVPATECTTSNSIISHAASGRATTYGKVAIAAAKLSPAADVRLKSPRDWKIAGKGLKRLDTPDKVTGKTIFGIDVKLPGMLNASIRHCPVFGGKLLSYDASKISGFRGIKKVIPVGQSAVAVVADTWWHANSALNDLPIIWDSGPHAEVSSATIGKWLEKGLDNEQPAVAGNRVGAAKAVVKDAANVIEAVYSYPYQHHATMEPLNATALYTPERCEVWTGTQNCEDALAAVVSASGLPVEKCEVYNMMLGGGFGRRFFTDYVEEAVLIAKQLPGTPVKLLWSREEDMGHGRYHPISQCKLVGAFDASKNLTGLHIRISGQSIPVPYHPNPNPIREALAKLRALLPPEMDSALFRGLASTGDAQIPYSFPNLLVEHCLRNPHIPPGWWRGRNSNQNAIYLECFMDELAHAVREDPVQFRLKFMANSPKHLAVLNAVAEHIGWSKPPKGISRGVAVSMGYGSYIAAVAQISINGINKIKIHRITVAIDPGHAVNPAQIERQVAGSLVYGLSALFNGEITVRDGRVEQQNFDSYEMALIRNMPEVEVIVMPTGGFWGGVGEPATCVAAPAVLNAFFAATGKRIRSIPLKNSGVFFA
jgi:isoquinoline 1-oxidoreductase beta subunit